MLLPQNTLKTAFPGLIIHPGNEKDLSSTLRFASKYRIRVVAKCSGHDQNCRSTGNGVIQVSRHPSPQHTRLLCIAVCVCGNLQTCPSTDNGHHAE